DFVEEFIHIYHHASCDTVCLMEGFWCGLDDDICFVLPRGDPHWTLKDYINFTLWVDGSTFTVDEADVDCNISIQPHLADISQPYPEPSPPSPHIVAHQPEPTADGEPSTTDEASPSGATVLRIALEPEPIMSDQVREPATSHVAVDVTVECESAEESSTHFSCRRTLWTMWTYMQICPLFSHLHLNYLSILNCLPAWIAHPASLPLLSPPIIPAASAPPAL
ncbi:hypothetical protein M9458_025315, partial [Cirrhinus mrigala]